MVEIYACCANCAAFTNGYCLLTDIDKDEEDSCPDFRLCAAPNVRGYYE